MKPNVFAAWHDVLVRCRANQTCVRGDLLSRQEIGQDMNNEKKSGRYRDERGSGAPVGSDALSHSLPTWN
jgi:hypothetical protein